MDSDVLDGQCPLTVRHPVMVHRWEQLTCLHWPYEPEVVQRLLPPGLTTDTYDGQAWVGLVPFQMWVAPPKVPALPRLGRFCETNVRTYVRDAHGRAGVWFFSLEASRLAAVVAARVSYRLPYFWSSMRRRESSSEFSYTTRRRWPGPRGAASTVVVQPGEPIAAGDVTELEHFLTARWRLFSHAGNGHLRYADVEHPPWPLRRAALLRCDDTLVTATGLPSPTGRPLVHYSPGVEVQIGLPRRVS